MILLDTHIWVWWVQGDPKLTANYQRILQAHQASGLGVSIYSCWEICKLVEYDRLALPCTLEEWFAQALALPGLSLVDMTVAIAIESTRLVGFHKDPADQIIVATAISLGIPLVTADHKILAYQGVTTLR
jgi:PIN domain nuclease of toxin-antitoxin system